MRRLTPFWMEKACPFVGDHLRNSQVEDNFSQTPFQAGLLGLLEGKTQVKRANAILVLYTWGSLGFRHACI